jgi:hypothetical protein
MVEAKPASRQPGDGVHLLKAQVRLAQRREVPGQRRVDPCEAVGLTQKL